MTKTPAAPFVLKGIVCPSRTDFRCTQRTLKTHSSAFNSPVKCANTTSQLSTLQKI